MDGFQTPKFTSLCLAAVLMVLGLALSACPKPKPPPPPVEEAPVRPSLRIESVVPDSTTEGRPVTVLVTGRHFGTGLEVFLGSRRVRGLDVIDTRELTFRATEDLAAGTYDLRMTLPDGAEVQRREAFIVLPSRAAEGPCELQTVRFDFNEAALTTAARQTLAENARCIELQSLPTVRLEGHADERGSTVYNLSLGERRAESVRQYLWNLGVRADLETLSYGEELPVDTGHSERSWAANRRVEFEIVERDD